jgi:hypothetical protein
VPLLVGLYAAFAPDLSRLRCWAGVLRLGKFIRLVPHSVMFGL